MLKETPLLQVRQIFHYLFDTFNFDNALRSPLVGKRELIVLPFVLYVIVMRVRVCVFSMASHRDNFSSEIL